MIETTITTDKTLAAVLLLFVFGLVGLCFSPGIGTGYIFDDFTSVVPLQALRGDGDHFWYYVLSDASGPFGRAVSIATFALEQLLFSAEPSDSQSISLALHAVNVFLVLVLVRIICDQLSSNVAWFAAGIVALLWGCAPQKVSTVLYIVQRMTILSGFFVLIALVSYWSARTARASRARLAWSALCVASLAVAPFAKETGVLGVFFIAGMELLLIPCGIRTDSDRYFRTTALVLLGCGAVGFLAVGAVEFSRSDVTYGLRNFTFTDRLLTTPVVLLDYAKQFFLPEAASFGVIHDDFPVVHSTDLNMRFWLATILIAASATFVVWTIVRGRRSFVAYGLFFFLVGHGIESTFLPLEIYFEHRNYLPSLGLSMLPLAAFLSLSNRHQRRVHRLASVAVLLLIASLGFTTMNVSSAWRSNGSLVEHHLNGHPRSPRALTEAALYLAASGNYDKATAFAARAYELSLEEPAARSKGIGDLALTQVMIACLAQRSIAEPLGAIATEASDDPFRGAAPRSLRRMFEDSVCPASAAAPVSDWVYDLVTNTASQGGSIRWTALADLAALEKQIGEPLRVYFYAAMASSQAPDEGTPLLMMVDASLALHDRVSLLEAIERLERLEETGKLGRAERLFLDQIDFPRD